MTISSRRGALALTIEGVGTVDGLYRHVWSRSAVPADLATVDADSLYVDGLLDWPAEIDDGIDPLQGEVRMGAARYALGRTSVTLDALWNQRAPITLGSGGPYSASATTLAFTTGDHASLQNTLIYWQREVIKIGTLSSTVSGVSTYIDCVRGALGSQAQAQMDGDAPDPEVYDGLSESLRGRIVKLIYLPSDAADYGDEETLRTSVLWDVRADHSGRFVLDCRPLWSLVQGARIGRDLFRLRPGERWTRTAPAAGYDGDRRLMLLRDGKRLTVESYTSAGGRYSLTGRSVEIVRGSPTRDPQEDSAGDEDVVEVISNLDQQPPNNATPGANDLPLSQSPGVLAVQLLTSTPNAGSPGGNGAFDTGISQIAGQVPAGLIDVPTVLERFEQYAPFRADNFLLYEETPLEDILQSLARMGGLTWAQSGGKLTVVPLRDLEQYGRERAITQEQILDVGIPHDRALSATVDAASATYYARPGLDPAVVEGRGAFRRRRSPPAASASVEYDLGFVSDEDVAREVVTGTLQRYHRPPTTISLRCLRTVTAQVGDVVKVTHPHIVSGGALGVTARRFFVYSRAEVFSGPGEPGAQAGSHEVRLQLADVAALYPGQVAWVAPSGKVKTWTGASRKIELYNDTYAGGDLATDAGGFAADDVVQICDQYGTVRQSGLVVEAVTGAAVTIKSSPSITITPLDGDILRHAPWTDQTTSQRESWASVAPSGSLGSDADNDYGYVVG